LSAIATDTAGNVSLPSAPISFTVDTRGVKIAIDSVLDDIDPVSGLLVDGASTNDLRPTVSGEATPGGVVKLYVDGGANPVGTATADSNGRWSITPASNLAQGEHRLTATVTTAADGESTRTDDFTLFIDSIAPPAPALVSVTDNVGSIRGLVPAGKSSDDTTPTLQGTAEAGSKVTIIDGTQPIGTARADALGNWSFTPESPLNDGTHPITITATDAAGNVSSPSAPWNVLVDTIAPTAAPVITSVVDDQGTSTGPLANNPTGVTDDASPVINGTSEANGSVIIMDGLVKLGTAAVNAAGVWSFTPTAPLRNGPHLITAIAVDGAGNVGPTSAQFGFTLVAGGIPTAPSITNVIDNVGTLVNVAQNGLTNDPTPTVEGTARAGYTVRLYNASGFLLGTDVADANGQWSITTPTLTSGTHSFTATATSPVGNLSDPTAAYQIVIDLDAPGKPTSPVSALEPPVLTDNVGPGPVTTITEGTVTNDATPEFTGKAEPGATVTVMDGLVTLGTALVDASGNWSFTPATPLEDGAHALSAIATDTAGNVSLPSAPISFTVDTRGVKIAIDSVLDDI
ncbi:MAG: hemagglutinin, partial [Comamonadaceae bacterium]